MSQPIHASILLALLLAASTLAATATDPAPVRTTRIPRWGDCTAPRSVCAPHLVCVGPAHRKRCNKPMRLNGRCGQDPYWVCRAGLQCQRGRCRFAYIAQGRSCASPNDICAPNLVCTGRPNRERCQKLRRLNARCGENPFAVCEDDLECVRSRCRRIAVQRDDSCDAPAYPCASDLQCAGPRNRRRCVRPIRRNGRCGRNPFMVCRNPLRCIGGRCRNPPVPRGGSCAAPDATCAKPLRCVGPATNRRCMLQVPLNARCGPAIFAVCRGRLRCANGRCRRRRVPKGANCAPRDVVCAQGLVCALRERRSRVCINRLALGQRCFGQTRGSGCERGLRCIRNRCSKIVGKNASCREAGNICASNLVCAGTATKKICVLPMAIGRRCGQDPFWVCVKGAKCVHGICKSK